MPPLSKQRNNPKPCFFCSDESAESSSKLKTGEYWHYLQPTPDESKKPKPPQTPPMCLICSEKIKEIAKCHREIVKLKDKLDNLSKQLDSAVKDVQKRMQNSSKKPEVVKKIKTKIKNPEESKGVKRSFDEMMAPSSSSSPPIDSDIDEMLKKCKNNPVESMEIKCEPLEELQEEDDSLPAGVTTDLDEMIESFFAGSASTSIPTEVHDDPLDDDSSKTIKVEPKRSPSKGLRPRSSSVSRKKDAPEEEESISDEEEKEYFDEDPDFIFEQTSSSDGETTESSGSEGDDSDDDEASPSKKSKPERTKKSKGRDPLSFTPTRTDDDGTIRKKKRPYTHKKRNCAICGEKLPLPDLLEHMKGHVGDYAYQCSTCSVTFPSNLSFTYYFKDHRHSCPQIKLTLTCEQCGDEIGSHFASRHFEGHETPEKNFTCPIPECGKTFTWRQSVSWHLRDHEPKKAIFRRWHGPYKNAKDTGIPINLSRPCEICRESLPVSTAVMHEHIVGHVGQFAFQCPVEKCRLTFASRYSKKCRNHCKNSKNWSTVCDYVPPPLKCEECQEEFDNNRKFRCHLERHETAQKNFTCPIPSCGKGFTVKQSVEAHLNLHAFSYYLQTCPTCPRNNSNRKLTPEQMEVHLKEKHGAKNVVTCVHCPFVFRCQEDLVDHIMTHVRSGIKCHLCDHFEIFRGGGALRRHYFNEHRIGKQYNCDSCDYIAFSPWTLHFHQKKFHEKKKTPFVCDVCPDKPSFDNGDRLKIHNIKLHGAEGYKCKFCDDSFDTRRKLNNHEKYTHRGVEREKYPCPECDMVLGSNRVLREHLDRRHSKEDYPCEQCGMILKSKITLRYHVKSNHEGPKHVCDECGDSFRHKHTLESHKRIHTGERPFVCKLCGASFRQNGSLHNHQKAHARNGDNFVPKKTFERGLKRQD